MSEHCRFNTTKSACNLEVEYTVLQEIYEEFYECFNLLRTEYHDLEDYCSRLQILLRDNGIEVPDRTEFS